MNNDFSKQIKTVKSILNEIAILGESQLKKPWKIPMSLGRKILNRYGMETEFEIMKDYVEETGEKIQDEEDRQKVIDYFPDRWKKVQLADKQKKKYQNGVREFVESHREEEGRFLVDVSVNEHSLRSVLEEVVWYAMKEGKNVNTELKKEFSSLIDVIDRLRELDRWPMNYNDMDSQTFLDIFSEEEIENMGFSVEDIKNKMRQ